MNKQRFVVCVVAAWVVATPAPPGAAQATAPCRPHDHVSDREPVPRGGVSRDGLVYFRVAYDHGVEPEHKKAFEGGMALWNAHRYSTGIAFELATSAIIDLRLQRGAPFYPKAKISKTVTEVDTEKMALVEQTTCAEYISAGPYIWYSRNILGHLQNAKTWTNEDVESLLVHDRQFAALAKIYAHELGHALTISHNITRKSLMGEGAADKYCWEQDLPDMEPADVKDAHDCVWKNRQVPRPEPTKRP